MIRSIEFIPTDELGDFDPTRIFSDHTQRSMDIKDSKDTKGGTQSFLKYLSILCVLLRNKDVVSNQILLKEARKLLVSTTVSKKSLESSLSSLLSSMDDAGVVQPERDLLDKRRKGWCLSIVRLINWLGCEVGLTFKEREELFRLIVNNRNSESLTSIAKKIHALQYVIFSYRDSILFAFWLVLAGELSDDFEKFADYESIEEVEQRAPFMLIPLKIIRGIELMDKVSKLQSIFFDISILIRKNIFFQKVPSYDEIWDNITTTIDSVNEEAEIIDIKLSPSHHLLKPLYQCPDCKTYYTFDKRPLKEKLFCIQNHEDEGVELVKISNVAHVGEKITIRPIDEFEELGYNFGSFYESFIQDTLVAYYKDKILQTLASCPKKEGTVQDIINIHFHEKNYPIDKLCDIMEIIMVLLVNKGLLKQVGVSNCSKTKRELNIYRLTNRSNNLK